MISTLDALHIDATITVVAEDARRGRDMRALFFDRASGQFYGGSASIGDLGIGAAAIEAMCWALHEYVRRGVLGAGPMPARSCHARPGDGLDKIIGVDIAAAAPPSAAPQESTPHVAGTVSPSRRPRPAVPAPTGSGDIDQTFARAAEPETSLTLTAPTRAEKARRR